MSAKLKITCLKFSLVAAFMLFLQVAFSQNRFALFDKAIEEKKKLLGSEFSVMVAVADSVAYQKAVGDIQPKTPVPIGASSQWLTTALILQLVDEGKLSLDDKVSQYLPVFDSYRKGYITIRHCLSHQTGIGTDAFKPASVTNSARRNTLEEEVADLVKKEIHANAGEQFRYSNYGPIIAARVAEVVTKKRFDQIIRTKLFVPLGMRNTSFVTDDGSAPNPSGGAKSTAADYTRFLQMLLNNGKAGEKLILSEASVNAMRSLQITTAQIKAAPKADEGFAFALGSWAVEGRNAAGAKAAVLTLPGFSGTWPLIDFSRGYAFVVVPKSYSGEQTTAAYLDLKKILDQHFPVKN